MITARITAYGTVCCNTVINVTVEVGSCSAIECRKCEANAIRSDSVQKEKLFPKGKSSILVHDVIRYFFSEPALSKENVGFMLTFASIIVPMMWLAGSIKVLSIEMLAVVTFLSPEI